MLTKSLPSCAHLKQLVPEIRAKLLLSAAVSALVFAVLLGLVRPTNLCWAEHSDLDAGMLQTEARSNSHLKITVDTIAKLSSQRWMLVKGPRTFRDGDGIKHFSFYLQHPDGSPTGLKYTGPSYSLFDKEEPVGGELIEGAYYQSTGEILRLTLIGRSKEWIDFFSKLASLLLPPVDAKRPLDMLQRVCETPKPNQHRHPEELLVRNTLFTFGLGEGNDRLCYIWIWNKPKETTP